MTVTRVPPRGAERQQWRAVRIVRGPDGDETIEGEWRDDRAEAVVDWGRFGAMRSVIEVQFIPDESAGDRIPVILRGAPKPAPGTMAYIGIGPCGCVTAVLAIDGPETALSEARERRHLIDTGRRIDRVTLEEANRRLVDGCQHIAAAA